jgi:hypothetical protein
MINGRLWRCPVCGGSDIHHKPGKIKESQQNFWKRIIAALIARIKKAA